MNDSDNTPVKSEQPFTNDELEAAREACRELLMSPRGDYIISQALHYGIEALEKVDPPHREESNLFDMKLLLLQFPVFEGAHAAMRGMSMTEIIEPIVRSLADE